MFRLKNPALVISQQQHARLAGYLAREWGNAQFAKPDLPNESFIAGVLFHDWHYGFVDNFPLDDLDPQLPPVQRESEWLEITRRGSLVKLKDPIADLISKRHLLRLLIDHSTEGSRQLAEQVGPRLERELSKTDVTREQLEFADRITNFCDLAAFLLFRQSPSQYEVAVYAQPGDSQMTSIACQVETGRQLTVDPWPFNTETILFDMIGYSIEEYPDELHPEILEIRICPR